MVTVEIRSGAQVDVAVSDVTAFYRHGWHSWSETRWLDPATRPTVVTVPERRPFADDPVHATRPVHGGSAVGAVRTTGGGVILLGALGLGGRVELDGGALVGRFEAGSGDWLVARGTERETFDRYAMALAERLGHRPRNHAVTMWSSWYSFYAGISEDVIGTLVDDVAGLGFDTFQVDDGWQQAVGDWWPNDRFPSGLAGLGKRIADRGMRPGLWIAPLIARSDSETFAKHPDCFLRDEYGAHVFAGHNWGGPCHALDTTHPASEELLAAAIGPAVEAGFTCLKLDFLCAAALPGQRHDDVPREVAYRRGIEAIRRIAGDDVYLLACGAPIVASLGVFDGIRIGPDVAPWWEQRDTTRYLHDVTVPNARYAVATSLHRLWLGSIIDTDPDVAYFRRRHCLLDDDQRAALQDLARIAGFRATSDPPAWLDPAERAALADFVRHQPFVEQLGGHRYRIDGREVDFTAVATEPPAFYDWHPDGF